MHRTWSYSDHHCYFRQRGHVRFEYRLNLQTLSRRWCSVLASLPDVVMHFATMSCGIMLARAVLQTVGCQCDDIHCNSLIDWISDTLSQGYTNLQSLVKCLDHTLQLQGCTWFLYGVVFLARCLCILCSVYKLHVCSATSDSSLATDAPGKLAASIIYILSYSYSTRQPRAALDITCGQCRGHQVGH